MIFMIIVTSIKFNCYDKSTIIKNLNKIDQNENIQIFKHQMLMEKLS